MPAASLRPITRTAVVVLAVCLTATLAACVDDPPTAAPTSSATPTDTSTPEPSDAPTAAAPEPLDIACGDLVDPDAVYAFNPNFALLGDWTPDAGTPAAADLDAGGVACRWVLESGGGTMDVSAARYTDDEILALKNTAFGESQMVPTYGEEAYFEVENGIGTATVFQRPFRLVVSSEAFAEPGEPTDIVESALAALAAL